MGNDENGARHLSQPVLLDVTNLVDYMVLHIFIGADDWPNHNWWAARRLGPESTGFKFFAWDQEISINSITKQHSSWGPLYAEVNAANTPAYVYSRCRANPEFRQLFADRIQRHLFSGGALTVSNNIARWNVRTTEVDQAVVAESARWGDYQRPAQPYRREVEFLSSNQWMRTIYFPSNHTIALNRFRAAKLYPSTAAPILSQFGGVVPRTYALTISNPNASGTIYFTTNGTDPRLTGGSILSGAGMYATPLVFSQPTLVRARVRKGLEWSALVEAFFFPEQDFTPLVVTEIMYHPPGASGVDGDEFEFLELKNIGTQTLDLSSMSIDSGIDFTFARGTRMAPDTFLVLVANSAHFAAKYPGVPAHGVYSGRLDNSGEMLRLIDGASNLVFTLRYSDESGWPHAADGRGFSLVPRDAAVEMTHSSSAEYWRASAIPGGSPNANDPEPLPSTLIVQQETKGTNSPFLLTWSDGAMVLEQATNLIGPWLSLPRSAVSPLVVWPTDSVGFFRLRRE